VLQRKKTDKRTVISGNERQKGVAVCDTCRISPGCLSVVRNVTTRKGMEGGVTIVVNAENAGRKCMEMIDQLFFANRVE